MVNFLLIIPDGWTPIDIAVMVEIPGLQLSNIKAWIADMSWATMAQSLSDAGLIAPDAIILEAMVFSDTNFLIRFAA